MSLGSKVRVLMLAEIQCMHTYLKVVRFGFQGKPMLLKSLCLSSLALLLNI